MSNPTQDTYRQRILRVQLFIQEHLDEDLGLERLARVAHFSAFHFHRIFTALVGEGVHEHVRRLRLERAAGQLSNTDRDVITIALDAGYQAHEAFTRAFKQMFGASPSRFRKERRELPKPVYPKESPMTTTESTCNVQVRNQPPRRVAFLRHVGPYGGVGPTFQRLMAWAGPRGVFGPITLVLGIYHDDPAVTAEEKLRADCCVTVGEGVQPDGDVGIQTIEGGDHAVLTHRGPYEELGAAYRWLFGTWLPASGREPRDRPQFEVYLNSPLDTPLDQLLTEIHLPLAPR